MTITAITIENFKGIKEPVRIEFKPITLLFGPNSAGKSTIIHALHYAHEIFERQNFNPNQTIFGGDSIDLGGFVSLVHQHDITLPIKLGFELDLRKKELPDYNDGYEYLERFSDSLSSDEAVNIDFFDSVLNRVEKAKVFITIRWSSLLEKPVATSYEININDNTLATLIFSDDTQQITLSGLNDMHPLFVSDKERKNVEKFREEIEEGLRKVHENLDISSDFYEKLKKKAFHVDFENVKGVREEVRVCLALLSITKKNIKLPSQTSALPKWGSPILLNASIFQEKHIPSGHFSETGFFAKMFNSLIVGPGELVLDELRKLCYIGPLRKVPERSYKPANAPENFRWANGLAAYDTLSFADDDFTDKVNKWLAQKERLDSGYSVKIKKYRELEIDNPLTQAKLHERSPEELINLYDNLLALPVNRRLLIRDEIRNIELMPHDIGVGISQVLPVVVAALHKKTGIVVIEQPELHIHPAFQVALGDLFIEQVREYPNLTFILETHSEHLMLRLLRRIRETSEQNISKNQTLTPDDLSIYFIERGETGITCLPIRVDEDGDFIDRWPRGFFAERAGELF